MPKKFTRRLFVKLLLALALIYGLGLLGLVVFQRAVLFPVIHGYVTLEEAHAAPELKELLATTEDGLKLTGWYAPATTKKLNLVFFHGNADSLRSMAPLAVPYIKEGYGFLIVEYRGYSGNPGHPSEEGLYSDARAFINALRDSGVKENEMVLYGHSLGSGVAVQMAMEYKAAGLILEAPYLSIAKMAQFRFPYFPAEMLAQDRFESFKKIPALLMPLLVGHGEWDIVVPFSQGRALFALAPEPKTFFDAPQGQHSDLAQYGFVEAVMKWLAGLKS